MWPQCCNHAVFVCACAKGPLGSAYSLSLTIVILVNVASFMLSTEPSMTQHQPVPVTYTLIVAIRFPANHRLLSAGVASEGQMKSTCTTPFLEYFFDLEV